MSRFANSTPCVSVVVPSYNHEPYLTQALASVLDQRGVDLELVIVDDGSHDKSWSLIEAIERQDVRVHAFRQTNQGAHAAINTGVAHCHGEFIAILNSDDCYRPDRLATLAELASTGEGKDFITTGLRLIDATGQLISHHPWLEEYHRMCRSAQANGLWATLLERNFTVSTSNFFVRRSLWHALGPIRPLRYNMDWDYALRAYLKAPERFAWYHDMELWDYRLHGDNTILGGLPVSAVEANYLLYRSIKQCYGVPSTALAGMRRHNRLIRQQQVATVAKVRDEYWETMLQEAHVGWAETRDARDQALDQLGDALTKLGQARDVRDHTLKQLDDALASLERTRQNQAAIYASRSYRIGRAITAPGRWFKTKWRTPQATSPISTTKATDSNDVRPQQISHEASAYCRIDLPEPIKGELPRVAVHVHVHYLELLEELLDAVSKVPQPFDLFITTTQEESDIRTRVMTRYPHAHIWQTLNQGKDVGPFIDALNRYHLNEYDLVLKLHSKKSQNQPGYLSVVRHLFGPDILDGDDWRRKLIAPIAGSREQILRIYQAFANDPLLISAGAARFICEAPDANPTAYYSLCQRLGVPNGVRFFGGTMFWIRGEALTALLTANMTLAEFDPESANNVEGTLEHCCERIFGALAAAHGGYLAGIDDLHD
jgi:glycosyltransferase involved in cell wall biosynthesis